MPLKVVFKVSTVHGLVDVTVSNVTSLEKVADAIILRRNQLCLTNDGKPTVIQWSEAYYRVRQVRTD
jgi:hypothetical protein